MRLADVLSPQSILQRVGHTSVAGDIVRILFERAAWPRIQGGTADSIIRP